MSLASVRWGKVFIGGILGGLIAVAGTFVLNILWGVVLGFQARGAPSQEVMIAAIKSAPFQIVLGLIVLLAGYAGGRLAGRDAEEGGLTAGLLAGILVAILDGVWRALSWGPDVTLVAHVLLAVAGGVLGGWLGSRPKSEEIGYAA